MAKYMAVHTYEWCHDVAVEIWDHDKDMWYRFSSISEASIKRLNRLMANSERNGIAVIPTIFPGFWFDGREGTSIKLTIRKKS